MNEIIGLILWHRDHGFCKLQRVDMRAKTIEVLFCGTGRLATYAQATFGRDLQHKQLPLESVALVDGRGLCRVIGMPSQDADEEFYSYLIRFDESGDTATLDEREMTPLEAHPKETLLSKMGACDSHSLYKVMARYQFLKALEELHEETGGLEALIGSRVELFPHQAYVAATVINDSVRRFILADEVGLGKTVEAGLVINDLLSTNPSARVLILSPGALSRQWLSELHRSFGNQGFKLADLYKTPDLTRWKKVICSMHGATYTHREKFDAESTWDLVIVDEAHHLLWAPDSYQFVENISRSSSGLLLLSAVPAREREEELLKLLRLLDPERYSADGTIARRFTELYRSQPQLGRGLRILDRDIAEVANGEAPVQDLSLPMNAILKAAVVSEDKELPDLIEGIYSLPAKVAVVEARRIRELIVDRYRLSRRIIKNRRSQLISQEMLSGVNRKCQMSPYEPDGYELEVRVAIEALIRRLSECKLPDSTKQIFFKVAYAAMSDPVSAVSFAEELFDGLGRERRSSKANFLVFLFGASYDEYGELLFQLAEQVSHQLGKGLIEKLFGAANAWVDSPNTKRRLLKLIETLPELLQKYPKLIIFAGTFGVASSLATDLRTRFGSSKVEAFTYDLDDDQKEKNILRFRTSSECRILVSDETGGEGRNFQFVDAIVHYDLPWSVAAIEQRVGRLDRIGRTNDVISHLIYEASSIEQGFVACLVRGFKVFSQSISGLEFMLRDSEISMIEAAFSLDWEKVEEISGQISQSADAERISDDAEALTDVGSFPGLGKIRFMHEISGALEHKLEESFVAYFKTMAKQSSAYQYADQKQPNLKLWCLKPDEISKESLPGIDKNPEGIFSEQRGTFQRLIARERRDIEFFCVGNPLFDAVASVAASRTTGRVFALGTQENEVESGAYLVIGMRCALATEFLKTEAAIQRRINQYFFSKRIYLTYRLGDDKLLESGRMDEVISEALEGKRVVSDLTKVGFQKLVENAGLNWMQYLANVQTIAFEDARKRYREKYGMGHELLIQELRKERMELARSPSNIGRDVAALSTLEAALEGWQSDIDVIGVMQLSI